MNEIELIYHYSKYDALELDAEEAENFKDHLECYELEIKLNGVTIAYGGKYHNKIFDFKDGFMLACKSLLTYYSVKKTFKIDLDY